MTTTKPTTAVQAPPSRVTDPQQSLAAMLAKAAPDLKKLAPKYVSIQRLTALAIEATQRNQTLSRCSPMSVLNFCKRCVEWGTDRVGAGGVWPVPFWNSKANCFDMQPIPDWRLLIERSKKARAITDAYADAVYSNDHFDYQRGTHPELIHKPVRGDRGKLTEVYCVYALPDGTKNFVVMDWESEIVPIRNRSKAWIAWQQKKVSCPWVTDEAEMGKKTVVKRTMKMFEGASPELTAMLATDNLFNGTEDIDFEPRLPIAMPKAIGETTPDPPADSGQPSDAGTTNQSPEDAYADSVASADGRKKTSHTPRNEGTATQGQEAQSPASEPETVQEQLAKFLGDSGVRFDSARSFMQTHGLIEDADSFGSFDDLPSAACEKLKANTKLTASLIRTFGVVK